MTPSKPISAICGMISEGKVEASSHSITCGAISPSANSRTVLRSCCCSLVRENSTTPHRKTRASGAALHLYHSDSLPTRTVYPERSQSDNGFSKTALETDELFMTNGQETTEATPARMPTE